MKREMKGKLNITGVYIYTMHYRVGGSCKYCTVLQVGTVIQSICVCAAIYCVDQIKKKKKKERKKQKNQIHHICTVYWEIMTARQEDEEEEPPLSSPPFPFHT